MTTTGNEIVQRTPEQLLVARVRDEGFKEQVAMVLPPTVTTEKFVRIAATAILTNPDIAKLEHNSVLRALVQAASAGLMPDGKQAAIVGRGGQASFMAMVLGYRQIAADHGWTMKSRVVHVNDDFEYSEEPPVLRHQPPRPGVDRGDRVAAYCIATHRDGRRVERVMYADEILKRREMATTKAVWDKWPEEMWAKTPTRDVFLDLPLSESDLEVNRIRRILEESDLAPGDAQRALYGDTQDRPALPPSAVTPPVVNKPSTTGPSTTEHAGDPQADDAPQAPQTPPAAASPVPGQDADDEPDIGGAGVATADDGTSDAAIELAGKTAALFEIPNGKHRGVTLGALLDVEDGLGWLKWALQRIEQPTEYVAALWNFARVFAPELYQEALAKKEASVQS